MAAIVEYTGGATDYPQAGPPSSVTNPAPNPSGKKRRPTRPKYLAGFVVSDSYRRQLKTSVSAKNTLAEIRRELISLPNVNSPVGYGSGVLPGQSGGLGKSVTESLGLGTQTATESGILSPGLLFMLAIGVVLWLVFGRK